MNFAKLDGRTRAALDRLRRIHGAFGHLHAIHWALLVPMHLEHHLDVQMKAIGFSA